MQGKKKESASKRNKTRIKRVNIVAVHSGIPPRRSETNETENNRIYTCEYYKRVFFHVRYTTF